MSKHATCYPSGFNYGYRPTSYFNDLDPTTLIGSSILGEERRKDVLARMASGDYDPLVWGEWLTDTTLGDSTRELIGRAHPSFMGGEYLPQFGQNEIEIARIVLASVTQDVCSIRASRSGRRIAYSVVDEYSSNFNLARKHSAKPLTLKELIQFIDHSNQEDDSMANGLVFSALGWNLQEGDPDSLRGFVSVRSSFYPELESYYEQNINGYIDEYLEQIEVA